MLRRFPYWIALWPCLVWAQDDALPAYVLLLPPSVQSVLIAETDTATLHRYEAGPNGLAPADEQRMSVGENGVGKQTTGDRRTPLGIYFVLEELDTSNLHEKYGPVAFPLDYPNAWDLRNNRSGHGIWIHGVAPGSGPRPERDTDGCIALQNESLLELSNYLAPTETPVIVTRSLERTSRAEIVRTRDRLLVVLQTWADSYRDGDWHQYLSLYADDFAYRGMSRTEWSTYRMQSAGDRPVSDFAVDEIMLLTDPVESGLYVSRFRQKTAESGRLITITKRLYWRETGSGELRIVAEDNG
ncbi:MAG: L,D-transpeptidase family protein [Proteobacteria bacterium]|nr:L,D-transpeptidase family protein [Pseudomonadota bacterium]